MSLTKTLTNADLLTKVLSGSQIDVLIAITLVLIIYRLVSGNQSDQESAGKSSPKSLAQMMRRSWSGLKRRLASVFGRRNKMAQELRYEILQTNDADSSGSALAEFRNESAVTLHIRSIDHSCLLTAAATGEVGRPELSKAPTFQSGTNNSPFWSYPVHIATEGVQASDAAGGVAVGGKRYGKGQLTLEPNESIFMNMGGATGAPTTNAVFVIGYQFG